MAAKRQRRVCAGQLRKRVRGCGVVAAVVPLVYPETFATGKLPQKDLEGLKILGAINEVLTNKEHKLLFSVHSQFRSCSPKFESSKYPAFAKVFDWDFVEFFFASSGWLIKTWIMRNVAAQLPQRKGKDITCEEAAGR
ncbi:MAG: hypothetical protein M1839_001973 [Geoglossum umbratile]|nr:MAG: hypothetical protein M1839_001973 [Geoglossum umbratile]